MGNSASNPSAPPLNGNEKSRNNNNPQPLISMNKGGYGGMYSPLSSLISISRTQCDASAPPAAPPPLPPPSPTAADAKSAAAAPPPPPAAASSAPPPAPPASPESDAIAEAAASATVASPYTNPGPYEQASMDAKRLVALDTWEGFRCDVSKQMNPFMVVIHSFGMSPASAASASPMGPPPQPPSSYTMVTQVGDESGVLVSRLDTARGSIDGRVQRMLLGGLAMGKLQLSLANSDNDMFLAELDFGTMIPACTWTANLKYGSMGGGPAWGINYWQAITPNLTLGGEGMYIGAQGAAVTTYAFKYNFQAPLTEQEREAEDAREAQKQASSSPQQQQQPPGMPAPDPVGASSIVGNFHSGNGMLTLNYRRVVTPAGRVTVGAELAMPVFDPFAAPPDVLVGAEFNLTRSKLQFSVDGSTGKLSSLCEAKMGMAPMSPRFGLSAVVDHYNQDYKFGYQINIEG